MSLRIVVARVNCKGQRSDGLDSGGRQALIDAVALFGQRACELLKSAVNFLERLWTGGKEAFKRDAEIGFENVFAPALAVHGIALLGGRNRVAALVLRQVHRGVRNLNELLRSGAMQGKRGDTEAGS